MAKKNPFIYSRSIKLGPAIGDWTTVQYRDTDLEEISISSVQNINFDSLPRDQLKYVHYVHYRLAEQLTKKISLDMDIKVELHTITATQVSYEDFLISQQDKIVQSDFFIKEVGRVNVILEWNLADMMVNRLTGGKGEALGVESFSSIEMSILKTQMDQIVPLFENAWKINQNLRDIALKTSFGVYQPDKKISLREAFILFTFYFYFGKDELRKLVVAYPNPVLRRLLYLRALEPDPLKQRIMFFPQTLRSIKVPLKVVLGQASLTMKELQNLQSGDVVMLDRLLTSPVDLCVGNKKFMKVQPGVLDNSLCVQLIQWDEDKHVHKSLQKSPIPVPKLLTEEELFIGGDPVPGNTNVSPPSSAFDFLPEEEPLTSQSPQRELITPVNQDSAVEDMDAWLSVPKSSDQEAPSPVESVSPPEDNFDFSSFDAPVSATATPTPQTDDLFDDLSFDSTHVAQQDMGTTESSPLDAFGETPHDIGHEDEFSWDDLTDDHHEEGRQ